jgi:hypothetical protein
MLFIFMFRKIGFESLCQFAPCQHDAPSTALAFKSNVRAEAHHRPFVGTAGVLFSQTQMIIEAKVREHIIQ